MYFFEKYLQPELAANRFQKWRELFYAFVIYYSIGIICALLILSTDSFVVKILHHQSIRHSHFKMEEYIEKIGFYKTLLLTTVKAPIIEEITFRLLLKPTRFNVALSMAFFVFLLTDTVFYFSIFPNQTIIITSFFLFCILYVIYNPVWLSLLKITSTKLLIITSLCFGAIHVTNFSPIYGDLFFLYPVYVLPQILLGFILGIIRIRNGFFWAVILHVLINGSVSWYKLFQ